MSTGIAAGFFLVVIGLVALSFGIYALTKGGRGQRGGFGPLSERSNHVVVGIRMPVRAEYSMVPGRGTLT